MHICPGLSDNADFRLRKCVDLLEPMLSTVQRSSDLATHFILGELMKYSHNVKLPL